MESFTDMNAIIQLVVVLGGTIGLSIPFGMYLARMISYEMRPLEAPLARLTHKSTGVCYDLDLVILF